MNPDFEIRDFIDQDYEFLLKLWSLTDMGGKERGDDLGVLHSTIEAGGKLLVMINSDGRLIGSSWMSHDTRRIYIHHFAIHPDFQSKGLARDLLNASMEYCKSLGLQIKLEVHQENTRDVGLYESAGFKKLEGYGVFIIRSPLNK